MLLSYERNFAKFDQNLQKNTHNVIRSKIQSKSKIPYAMAWARYMPYVLALKTMAKSMFLHSKNFQTAHSMQNFYDNFTLKTV